MRLIHFFIGAMVFITTGCAQDSEGIYNGASQYRDEIFLADPTIIREGDMYYLTGTGNQQQQGFVLLESADLKSWHTVENNEFVLKKGDQTYGTEGFWAPQWYKAQDRYYFIYTANEQLVMASADSWKGPFRQTEIKPIDRSQKNIDPFLFRDDDGRYYLYHVRFNNGNYLWVAEFDLAKGEIIPGTLKKCMESTEEWEATAAYISAPVMEGPTVIKLDGVYYLFYSANDYRSIDYAVGYATSNFPTGPWTKNENSPIIHRSIVGENGSGHGDIFTDKAGNYYYVYHVHASKTNIAPRKTRIVPLHMEKNKNGIYDITVNGDEVIEPYQE